jgi:hypothetical protein
MHSSHAAVTNAVETSRCVSKDENEHAHHQKAISRAKDWQEPSPSILRHLIDDKWTATA